jgi:fused signal recognition particle receptor
MAWLMPLRKQLYTVSINNTIRMFSFIKNTFNHFFTQFKNKLSTLLGKTEMDTATLHEVEVLLLSADTGVKTTRSILNDIQQNNAKEPLHERLSQSLNKILEIPLPNLNDKKVFLIVGINGSGKTTTIGKLAQWYTQQNKRVLIAAADTFRAAATEQVVAWAKQTNTDIVTGTPGKDSASVVYTSCEKFIREYYDILLIDTAGRLQTKINLMHELTKIRKTISRFIPDTEVITLLTVDSMLGQNSLEQATVFKECATVDGIILTKTDGTGKGGIVFAIAHTLHIPIIFVSYGESVHDFSLFDAPAFIRQLVYEKL